MGKNKWEFIGLDEYLSKLRNLSDFKEYAGSALYEGASIVADEIKAAINSLPVRDKNEYGSPEHMLKGVTEEQKAGLREGFGISHMKDDSGILHVKLGFAGYNSVRSKAFPNGQPNPLIARSLESGTSWLKKNQFITKATKASMKRAEAAIAEELDKQLEKLMNN